MTPTATRLTNNAGLLTRLGDLPDHRHGEVIAGELFVSGPFDARHQFAVNSVGLAVRSNALLVVNQVSVRFTTDEEVVPDVAGWRRERLGDRLDENPIRVRPDWVCEILSDSTRLKDLGPKRKLYAQQGVPYLWLVDPHARVLEAFELVGTAWQLQGTWSRDDVVKGLAPFPELTIQLRDWWLE